MTSASVSEINLIINTLTSETFLDIQNDLGVENVSLFKNSANNTAIGIFRSGVDTTVYYAAKGILTAESFVFIEEVLMTHSFTNQENGLVAIQTGEGIFTISVVDGEGSIQPINENIPTPGQRHGGTGFCQREANETAAECYKAEKEEFCDSLVACLALDLLPEIPIMIAISCTCRAK